MLVVQRIADLPIPPLGEFAWKVAVVTFGANAVYIAVAPLLTLAAWIFSFVTLVGLMAWLFRLELWQILVVTLATWLLRAFVIFALVDLMG